MADPILTAFNSQLRDVAPPRAAGGRFERVGPVIRWVSESPDGWNWIEWSTLDESTADAVIAEQVAYFAEHGRQFEWKHYSYDQPADLPDRLRAAGLAAGEEEALMIAEVADTPLDTPPPPGLHLRPATSEADLALVRRVHEEVFGGDYGAFAEELRERLRADPESLVPVLVVTGEGEPVCAARIDFHAGTDFASLWGGGTVPAWRHRGVYRATVSYRARLAAERGYRYLRTDALPPSRPILERLGFRQLCTTTPFTSA